jgi:hypothetical protein
VPSVNVLVRIFVELSHLTQETARVREEEQHTEPIMMIIMELTTVTIMQITMPTMT